MEMNKLKVFQKHENDNNELSGKHAERNCINLLFCNSKEGNGNES